MRNANTLSRFLLAAFPIVATTALACSSSGDSGEGTAESTADSLVSCGTIVTPDPTKSLFVTTDLFSESATPTTKADSDFSLEAVLTKIAATGSSTGETAAVLYQQLVDTMNTTAGALGKTHFTTGPHCDDAGSPILANGFPVQCPRPEGGLANFDVNAQTPVPFSTAADGYHPVALVNRFDLAPKSGSNCGQYRVVFGKNAGSQNASRFLVIFEAVLPNPKPSEGLAACTPVAEFWDSLTSMTTSAKREAALEKFYFTGLKGFSPVISASHYGFGNTTDTGQIRINMLSSAQWQLREFRLEQVCSGTGNTNCNLIANNTPVQNNPNGALFALNSTAPGAAAFQTEFLTQVKTLAATDVNKIGMTTPAINDDTESNEQFSQGDLLEDNFSQSSQGGGNAPLQTNIVAKLPKNSTLTALNILDRATTQTCAGCHELMPGHNIGGGLTWPLNNPAGFTQIDEQGHESPALTGTFLPFRAKLLKSFLESQCADSGAQDLVDDGTNLGGGAVGAAN